MVKPLNLTAFTITIIYQFVLYVCKECVMKDNIKYHPSKSILCAQTHREIRVSFVFIIALVHSTIMCTDMPVHQICDVNVSVMNCLIRLVEM